MRVLVAPDELGGTLPAAAAARAIAEGWLTGAQDDEVDEAPLSDGGPGFVDVLSAALPGARLLPLRVSGPLGVPVPARLLLHDGTAYVESAEACGLHLLGSSARDPRLTTSYGVGELVAAAAAEPGVRRIVVGLGGSATNDGGAGLLAALGRPALDGSGASLEPGGAALARADRLSGRLLPALADIELVAAADVDVPLLGRDGATRTFAPQKGADPTAVDELEAALQRWADLLEGAAGRDVRGLPGSGAAGGLGAAVLALGGEVATGAGLVAARVGLPLRCASADLVVTGEGTFDATSLRGKVVSEVARAAQTAGRPCVVLAGQVLVGRREAAAYGIDATYALVDEVGREAAVAQAAQALRRVATRVAGQWSRG